MIPAAWLRVFVRVQDSRAPWYRQPATARVRNPLDLRGVGVEIGRPGAEGWGLRAGRQVLRFGAERLVGRSDWGNVGRVFDAVRLSYRKPRVKLDWFASAVVRPDQDRFDRFRANTRLHGAYSSIKDWPRGVTIEPYLFWKSTSSTANETGRRRRLNVYTTGARIEGPLPRRFDYSMEVALQSGQAEGGGLRSWAGAWIVGRGLGSGELAPRLSAEYDYASGDGDPADGRRGTFDQLYPTNHGKYGIADRMGWRNMHGARVGIVLKLKPNWSLNIDYHSFWLASRQDFLYWSNGAPVVRNPNASSNHVHQEIDIQTTIKLAKPFDVLFGYAHLFPGRFLKESSPGSPSSYAYAMWRLRF